MRILSLSTVYPNPCDPILGLFVKARLDEVARLADLQVIAPVPLVDYAHGAGGLLRSCNTPAAGMGKDAHVRHPKWVYPPGGMPVNVLCLFARLLPVIQKLRREFPFDLIDAHFAYPEGVVAALLGMALKRPFTITLRGSETIFAEYPHRRRLMQFAFRRAAAVIGVAENLTSFAVSEGASPDRAATIPNGVDTSLFFPRDRDESRRQLGLRTDERVIVSAGELIEAKGHHLVIHSLRGLINRGVMARLIIAGKTGRGGKCFETELRALVAELELQDHVRFAGWTDRTDLAALFSAADVFTLASYTEGWPNVVHEALSCGAPVVVSDVGGVRALVPQVQYGSIVPVRDANALEQALLRALLETWDRKAIAAWGRSRDWSQVAREVVAVFDRVLKRDFAGAVLETAPGGPAQAEGRPRRTDYVRH